MSEVLAAVHANLEVLAISLVTNACVDSHEAQQGDSHQVLDQLEGVEALANCPMPFGIESQEAQVAAEHHRPPAGLCASHRGSLGLHCL